MGFIYYNPNSCGVRAGDCSVRALCKALNWVWDEAYEAIARKGFFMCDMPSSNAVWGAVLRDNGFTPRIIPPSLPYKYTVGDFARDNPRGTYVVVVTNHVVCVRDGHIYDTWDSSREHPLYFFEEVQR